jgi:rhodanese-related sulfurtransferase
MGTMQGRKKYLGVSLLLLFPISALLVLSTGPSSGPEPPATSQAAEALPKVNIITAQELQQWLEQGRSFLLLDARSPAEFASGHIPTAVSMPLAQSSTMRARRGDQQLPVVFYCNSYSGSTYDRCFQTFVREFQNASSQAYWFKEGMKAWRAQGYPVMTSSR